MAANPVDTPRMKARVVDDDHHDIDRNLWSDGGVGLKVEGAIEHVTEREGAGVRGRDGDRHGKAEPAVQTHEDRQIDAEAETVDQAEAKKCRCNDRSESQRKPTGEPLTPRVESVGQA
jgi:hypothetical protein